MKIITFKNLFAGVAAAAIMFSCSQDETLSIEQDLKTIKTDLNLVKSSSQEIPGQYIIVYNTSVTGNASKIHSNNRMEARKMIEDQTLSLLEQNNISSRELLNVFTHTINGSVLMLAEDEVERVRNDKRVAYLEKDRLVTLAPPAWAGGGGGGSSTGQEIPYGILRVNGGVNYTGSNVAWVIDTGIDIDHEDLNVDASRGFNAFTTGRDAKSIDDGNGHGTHVAGTIAGIDNGVGIVGVAAGAIVIPVKVLDSRGSGSYSGVIAGVDFVGANGTAGDVANMSLGGPVSQALDDAVVAASQGGVKFVLAAGNESDDANSHSPARANGSNVYTVSAMDVNDNWASFSNYGNPPVDFCAPGVAIKSTWSGGGYNTISGTSMASPHAAGVLLLGNGQLDGTVNNDPDGNADAIIVN